MKIQLKYIFLILLLGTMFSCTDYLDKESDTELTMDMVFTDKDRMESMLAYVYSGIPDPTWGYLNRTGWGVMGDDWTPSERWQQWGWDAIPKITGNWNTATEWDGSYWGDLPKRIRTANILRANVVPIDGTTITAQEVEYIQAECRFLQAYYYSLFVNCYGVCPFQPDYVAPTDGSTEELLTGPVPYDEIIEWCDNEMLEASKILPASYTQAIKYGRVTSVMCLAARARMLLFAASPLVNGNPDYTNFTDTEGTPLFNSSYDQNKWTKALEAHRLLIQEAEAAGHELYKMYNDDGSIDAFASTAWVHARTYSDGNKEILFARPQNQTEFDRHISPYGAGGNGGLGMTQSIVDAFFMDNGLSPILGYENGDKTKPIINPESGYTESGFSDANDVRNTDNWNWYDGEEKVAAKAGTFNMYVNREPRFYNAILWNERYYIWDRRNVDFYQYGKDNNYTHDAPQNGYLGLKRKHPNSDSKNGSWQYRPGIVYRLAEAYLSYCEILNEVSPGNQEILTYLNLIRERAGIPQYATSQQDGYIAVNLNDQDEMREIIRRERRVELCGEGVRYDDLRRWKEAEDVLDGDFYGMNFSGTDKSDDPSNPKAFYVRTQYQKRVYQKKYYWFPIFQDEIDKNPNLVQSPYWTESE
ncbi:RagB/SusD family nutrient uptake outer membrane protein [uncultured Draconibacterium sp.]|uniref:RagB/SusD family nutrient uptake outer membrane protein n=1 Tax=uncultured Draconibacterium sp. TaxID=1573823 RepID=UPI0029C95955|nr:RagB/SusD family nutrient uptake outer membrane protein [uncultured Draconibacterium sp.]